MKLHVDIQTACTEPVPAAQDIRNWIATALDERVMQEQVEVSVRLVDEEEMAKLNATYRGKTGATNVLSFPASLPAELDLPLLGDIVICAPVVSREALEQGKSTRQHWAHLVIHGVLHLLGFDHQERTEAEAMEARETALLALLGFGDPYRSDRPAVDGT